MATADEMMYGYGNQETPDDDDMLLAASQIGDPMDLYIVGLFCGLFACFISFLAIVIGYYSWLEDALMKENLQKADTRSVGRVFTSRHHDHQHTRRQAPYDVP